MDQPTDATTTTAPLTDAHAITVAHSTAPIAPSPEELALAQMVPNVPAIRRRVFSALLRTILAVKEERSQ